MLPYYILIFVPIIFSLFEKKYIVKHKNIPIVIFFIIMIVFLSLRSIKCGTDLKNYLDVFKQISRLSMQGVIKNNNDRQLLFFLLNKIVSNFTDNFQILLTIIACVSIIPIAILYRKESENPILTIALFMTVAPFSIFFSGLKQSIAIGIVVISFQFIKQKKIVHYLLLLSVAMLFHKSAIYCIILYPIYNMNITKRKLCIIIPIIISIFIFRAQVFNFFINNFADSSYLDRYNFIESNGAYSILILLIIFGLYCFILPDKNKIDKEYIGLRNFLILAICIQCFASINPNIMRINYYNLIFIPILIPKVEKYCKEGNIKITNIASLIMTIFFFSYFIYNGYFGADILNIFPYIAFWEV